ncbi:putative GAF sensor protein, partial [Rhodanobacter denitrificans]
MNLDAIRECFDGSIPGVMATCAPDGTPNVAYLSQIEYLDGSHLALSFQFFNKTRQNILANPQARLLLIHPQTAAMYRLSLHYLRTETEGPLFERMRAKLAGIASHVGMGGVFRLKGSDVYRVQAIEQVPGRPLPPAPPRRNLLAATRHAAQR